MTPVRASRVRVVLTVLATVLIISSEFLMLAWVYDRGHPVRDQRVVVSVLMGRWQDTATPVSADELRALPSTLDHLARLGISRSELTPLRVALGQLAADPSSESAAKQLQGAVQRLDHELADAQGRIDLQADLIYVALLVTVSLGWMVWFRRLVSRHRALQHRITEQDARAAGERRLGALVRSSSDVVAVCDPNGAITFVTPSIHAVLGYEMGDVVDRPWIHLVEAGDRDAFLACLDGVPDGSDGPVNVRMRHADGRVLNVEGSIANLVSDPDVGGMVITIRDITTRVTLERELTHQAFHDDLTGLPNRQLFTTRLAAALVESTAEATNSDAEVETSQSVTVLYFDLDEFKNVNDRLGHGIGDQVLIEISERALSATRDGDTVARLGGDEFAILMPGTDLVEAHALAEALREQLSHPMTIDGHALSLGASVGLVHALPGELSGEDALRNADVAMYLAKDRGKGTVAVYEPRLHAEALDRLQLSAELERAITHGGLVLHYQPTVDLSTGAIAGFEALVRWQHPVRGLLAPYTFIPLAEQTGLIQGLGSWVLRTACASAVELGKELPVWVKPPTMAVNVTAQQLAREDFVDEVLDVLRCSGLAPARLTIEITESVLMQDVTAVIARLGALRDLGIRIAIDDFGTGYSSLAYLRNLPLDILKVDKAFIDHVVTDAHDAALTGVILAMSAAMDLKTVGEGVEALDQAVWLTAANCDYGQGYYWSRPVPIEQARGLLRSPAFRRAGVPIELPSAAVAIG